MYDGTVEKSNLRQTEITDSVPVVKAFDIWPVLLSRGRAPTGQCGQCHLALEPLRYYLVDVGLLTVDDAAIRQGDADRRRLRIGSWDIMGRLLLAGRTNTGWFADRTSN